MLDGVPGVLRTAAVAVNPPGGGPSELVVYVVPRRASGEAPRAALAPALQQALKTRLNPLFRICDVVLVPACR